MFISQVGTKRMTVTVKRVSGPSVITDNRNKVATPSYPNLRNTCSPNPTSAREHVLCLAPAILRGAVVSSTCPLNSRGSAPYLRHNDSGQQEGAEPQY